MVNTTTFHVRNTLPDGKWLWNGTEWIPAPPTAAPAAVESAQATIEQVAQSTNTPVQELTQIAHHYDLNQDNSLSEYELSWLLLPTTLHLPTFHLRKARSHQTGTETKSWHQLRRYCFTLINNCVDPIA